jgi:hypothetical protein
MERYGLMVPFWSWINTLLSLAGLAASLCLGFYIVTRTPRSRLSRLAALTLWSLSLVFLHNALIVTLPGSGVLPWLRPVTVLALAFGFHLILLLPPGREPERLDFFLPPLRIPAKVQRWLGRLAPLVARMGVPLAYSLALALVLAGIFPLGLPSGAADGPAVFLSDRAASRLYPLSVVYLLVLGSLASFHLWQGWSRAPRGQKRRAYTPLFAAVLLTVLGSLYLILGVWLQVGIPSFPGDVCVGVAALLLGYVVARHHARIEGRAIERDLVYIGLVIGAFTILYVLAAELLYLGGHVFSAVTLVLIVVVAISSLMLYDGLRTTLDRLFYRKKFQQLRANLRSLSRESGIGQALPDRLQTMLTMLCTTLGVRRGFVAVLEDDAFVCRATIRAQPLGQTYPLALLSVADIAELPQPGVAGPEDMAFLVPIFVVDDQIGAMALGRKEDGSAYSVGDMMLLDDVADRLAVVIENTQLQEENARVISELVAEYRDREHGLQRQVQRMLADHEEEAGFVLKGVDDQEFASSVEDALRHLHDYAYLGEHALAQLQIVDWHLKDSDEGFLTHIDRGKALSEVMAQAVHKLRPDGKDPVRHSIPPREWHSYVILHDSYVLDEMNRDIMSRLYISEGTFNRTRRRAIRGVARALQEMEQEARHKTTA